MPYQSILKSNSGGSSPAPSGTKPKGYSSILGLSVAQAPDATELAARRKKKKQDDDAARVKQQQVQQQQNEEKRKNSLLGKATRVAKTVGNAAITSEKTAATGIARTLPGGTADLDAQVAAADQKTKSLKMVKDKQKTGQIKPEAAKKLTKQIADDASQTSKETAKIVKDMPSKGQVAAGFIGTGADVISGGTFSAATKSAKLAKGASLLSKAEKIKKVAKVAAPVAAANAVSGGANAAAGGGDAKTVAENAIIGAAAPTALGGVAHVTGKALTSIMDKVRVPKELIQNAKTRSLLDTANKKESDKALAETTKLDQQIELINAKKADGKFSNVDKVKVKQLEQRKQELSATTPSASVEKPATPVEPTTQPNTAGSVPTIKAYGREIELSEKNGYKPIQTESGVVYQKASRSGTNSKDASFHNNWYDSNGNKLTHEQAQAAIAKPAVKTEGSIPTEVTTKPDTATIKEQINKIKNDEKSYDANGNISPEAGQQITALNKQLNAAGERVPKADKPVTVTPIDEPTVKQPKIGQSKLAASTEQKAIDKKLTEGFEGRPEYAKVNVKDQAAAAHELHKADPARAERIALGQELPPDNLLPESVYIAVENHALKTGNVDLLRRLATESNLSSEATGMGQRIRMLGERNPDSAVSAMRKLADSRKKVAEKRLGKTVTKAVSEEVKQIRAAVPKVEKETWGSFVDSLKC